MNNLKLKVMLIVTALTMAACTNSTASNTGGAQPSTGASQSQQSAVVPISTRTVATTSSVSVDGALDLSTPTISLGFDTTGKVTAVNAKPGHAVKKGDVLATLDDTSLKEAVADADLALQLTQANLARQNAPATKEDLTAAQAQLSAAYAAYQKTAAGSTASDIEKARVNADSAWLSYLSAQSARTACSVPNGSSTADCQKAEAAYGNAYESLLAARDSYQKVQQPVSQDTLTQAYAAVVTAKNKLETLKTGVTTEQAAIDAASLNQVKSTLELAKTNLSKATLLSPCDCVVQAVNVSVGMTAPNAAFTLVNLSRIQFKTSNLSELNVSSIKVAAPVTIRLKSYTDELKAKVTAVLAQSTATKNGEALYTVLIALDPSDLMLLPGMTGQADITIQ